MTRIVWKDYIRDQLHWAERLSELAREEDNGDAARLAMEADRARRNADGVTQDHAAG